MDHCLSARSSDTTAMDTNIGIAPHSNTKTSTGQNPHRRPPSAKPLTPSSALYADETSTEKPAKKHTMVLDNLTAKNPPNNGHPPFPRSSSNEDSTPDSSSTKDSVSDPNTLSSTPNSNLTNSSRRFSFNKRPVSKSGMGNRKSSQISVIHSYPSQRCDSVTKDVDHSKFYMKYKGIMKDKDELPDNALNDLSFEYNYDEKIRAPRMSVISLISSTSNNLNPTNRNKLLRQTSSPALFKVPSNTSSDHTLDSLQEEESKPEHLQNNTNNFSYKPASYDLSSQLRKFSLSNDDTSAEPEKLSNPRLFTEKVSTYSFPIKQRKKSTVSNSSSNVSPTREKLLKIDDDIKPLKQIDEPVKLLDNYVPPVLRPIQQSTINFQKEVEKYSTADKKKDQSNIYHVTKTSQRDQLNTTDTSTTLSNPNGLSHDGLLTPPTSTSDSKTSLFTENDISGPKKSQLSKVHSHLLTQLNAKEEDKNASRPLSPSQLTHRTITDTLDSVNQQHMTSPGLSPNKNFKNKNKKSIEPSHSHWKPNPESNFCEHCSTPFNFFKRKHHCRHCGGLFCSSCLQNYSNLNLLAHFERPQEFEYIPVNNLKNPLLPIKSTETAATFTTIDSINTNNTLNHVQSQVSSSSNKFSGSVYSKFCKVCPECYSNWLEFLNSDQDYEGRNLANNYDDLLDSKINLNDRKDSLTGVPTDWNWSSF